MPKNGIYQVGLVGTGGIARAHGNACQDAPSVELAAIHDVSEGALAGFGEQFNVAPENRYLSLDEMLDSEDLDIAVICTWGAFHAEVGIKISESRQVKAILCEKPFTSTAAEAEAFVGAAQENGILVAEAFKFRHHPMHIKAKEMIDSGAIGEFMTLRSTFCTGGGGGGPETRKPEANWRFNKAKGGGSIYDLACYNIHHARFMFGAEPIRVSGASQAGLEVDDASYLLLVFPNEKTAQISTGFNCAGGQYAEMTGLGGMLRIDAAWNNSGSPVKIVLQNREGHQVIDIDPVNQFAMQLEHMCECLKTGQSHRISPESCVNQMRVIDAAFEAMATGRTVELG
ncbi:MAG: Gfo/Idh/MocA family oxidoreductase [Candidatus Poribacteria bacterium]|nr:Gfo/Idh/MocA family oxidoreductase [Candidatus Poribacteria bacterium]